MPNAVTNSGWPRAARRRITNFALVLGLAVTVVWSVTGAGYFWPGWVWLGLVVPFAFLRTIRRALRRQRPRPLAVHAALSLVLGATGIFIWLMGGLGYFWPSMFTRATCGESAEPGSPEGRRKISSAGRIDPAVCRWLRGTE
ncbi:MAG: hypothetical protein HIU57_09840 [Acidobacteria bacterium]|nr:hypothetical protein [Acidobacteriota bacterium]